jgi:SAM-dependent methyltransferase
MPKIGPFEKHAGRYEEWFERNRFAYQSELRAVGNLLPQHGIGVEIGVGTGRFAAPLGVKVGIEPSKVMAVAARQRGIQVVQAVAEALPFMDGRFDFALMVTTLCFLDDVEVSFQEAHRVLRCGGSLVVGFIDPQSHLGQVYQQRKNESPFYREARFYSVQEVISSMENAGFGKFASVQTICDDLQGLRNPEPVRSGYGQGSFVVLRGTK